MEVKSLSELTRRLNDEISKAMNTGISDDMEDALKSSIDEHVYKAYSPSGGYSRTYTLRNSVKLFPTKRQGGAFVSELGHDERELQGYTSISGSHNVSPFIPEIISKGLAGAIYHEGYWKDSDRYKSSHTFAQPRPYIDEARKNISQGIFRNSLKAALKDQGLKVK